MMPRPEDAADRDAYVLGYPTLWRQVAPMAAWKSSPDTMWTLTVLEVAYLAP